MEHPLLMRARRLLTEEECEELAQSMRAGRKTGMFASQRGTPRLRSSIGKLLLIAVAATVFVLVIRAGWLSDIDLVVGGGIRGQITVDLCHASGRSFTCWGTFRSDPHYGNIVIHNAEVADNRVLKAGPTYPARIGTPTSSIAYPNWTLFPLAPLVIILGSLLALIVMLVAWPLRAAIHLWRPDVWPYWIGTMPAPSGPRAIRIGRFVARVSSIVLSVLFVLSIVSGFAGLYGIVFCIVVAAIVASASWFVRWRRRRAEARPSSAR